MFRRLSDFEAQDLYVRPMFEVAWGPIVGSLSHNLEYSAGGGGHAAGGLSGGSSSFDGAQGAAQLEEMEVVGICLGALQDARAGERDVV